MSGAKSAAAELRNALQRRDRAQVTRSSLELIKMEAPLGSQWGAVAQALQHNCEHDAAISAVRVWLHQRGPRPEIGFALSAVLARAGRLAEAHNELDSLPAGTIDPSLLAYTRGTLALNMGNVAGARSDLSRSAALNPGSGQAWLALAMTGKLDADTIGELRGAAQAFAGATDAEAGAYHYALAKVDEHAGRHDDAFEAVELGASIMRRLRTYDMAADDRNVAASIDQWDRHSIAAVAARLGPPDGAAPIIVTGLPRSGTTLVEHILANHSEVTGGDEMALFAQVQRDIGDISPYALGQLGTAGLRNARKLYQHLARQRFTGPGLVVDKTLAASRMLGLAVSLFPEAPILWVRRDPADCAWAAYRTFFLRSVDWSWSLADIGHFFRNEDRLLAHWVEVLGDRILVVPYEEMVIDSNGWIKRITRFAGLEVEPPQFEPHKSRRAVTTASVVQVRDPIDQRGVGVSAPHIDRMAKFFDAYRPN